MTTDAEQPAGAGIGKPWRRRGKAFWILWITVAVLVLGSVVLKILPRPKEKLGAMAPSRGIAVQVERVAVGDIPDVATYPARVEEMRRVKMAAEQSGRVVWLGADKGDSVTNGQVLLRIDDRMFAATVERAAAVLKQVSDDFKRMEELKKTGAISSSDFENLATQKELAAIALKQAQVDLDRCSLVSTVDGLLEDRLVEVGEYVNPGMGLFTLVAIDEFKLVTDIPERDIFATRTGQEVLFRVDAFAEIVFTGRVTFVASAADPGSNTFRVEATVKNSDHRLKSGILGKIPFTRRLLPGVVHVPMIALIPDKGMHVAYVVENGHAVRRQVRISAMIDRMAIISEGLKAGETVIVEGQRLVVDGSPVDIVGPAPADPENGESSEDKP